MAGAPAFQADYAGSIPATRSLSPLSYSLSPGLGSDCGAEGGVAGAEREARLLCFPQLSRNLIKKIEIPHVPVNDVRFAWLHPKVSRVER